MHLESIMLLPSEVCPPWPNCTRDILVLINFDAQTRDVLGVITKINKTFGTERFCRWRSTNTSLSSSTVQLQRYSINDQSLSPWMEKRTSCCVLQFLHKCLLVNYLLLVYHTIFWNNGNEGPLELPQSVFLLLICHLSTTIFFAKTLA